MEGLKRSNVWAFLIDASVHQPGLSIFSFLDLLFCISSFLSSSFVGVERIEQMCNGTHRRKPTTTVWHFHERNR